MEPPPFDQFAEFIRQLVRYSPKKTITPETLVESDLGVTGDDGDELLEAVEQKYHIRFCHKSFGLRPDEALFHSEGFFNWPINYTVYPLTVGELYEVVCRTLEK